MIIEESAQLKIQECLKTGIGTYAKVIPYYWTIIQYNNIQRQSNNKYSIGMLDGLHTKTQKWMVSDPNRSIIRLRKLNRCSYCDAELYDKNGEGDHIVGRELDQVVWLVPCCPYCNSSKGKKDLLEWWHKKERRIDDLRTDVLSIYLRGKFKLLSNKGIIDTPASDTHIHYLRQLWGRP